MNTETQPDPQHARRPVFYGPTYLFDALSHAPIMVKIPEDLPAWDMPLLCSLRVTPLENLSLAACRLLISHNHSGDLRLTPSQIVERKHYYWRRICEAEGIPSEVQANGRTGGLKGGKASGACKARDPEKMRAAARKRWKITSDSDSDECPSAGNYWDK